MRIKGDGVYTYVIETNTKQHLNVNIYGLLQQIVGLQRADLVIFKRGVPNQDKGGKSNHMSPFKCTNRPKKGILTPGAQTPLDPPLD